VNEPKHGGGGGGRPDWWRRGGGKEIVFGLRGGGGRGRAMDFLCSKRSTSFSFSSFILERKT
jgi:hypothetical protein